MFEQDGLTGLKVNLDKKEDRTVNLKRKIARYCFGDINS